MGRKRAVGNGEGTIYKDSTINKWIYQYYFNGKRKKMKQRKGETKKHFLERVVEIKNQLNNGNYIDSNNITIYELGMEIIEDKFNRNQINENSYRRDMQTLNHIKNSSICNRKVQKANYLELQRFLNEKIQYSNSLINKVYRLLNSIFKEAIKRNLILKSPMDNVEKPKSRKPNKRIEALSEKEQQAFLNQLTSDEPYRDIFIIALYTGMRMGEILALKLEDIDLINKEIHIRRTLTKNRYDKTILGDTTKTYAGTRTIPITPLFEDELRHAISTRVLNINNLIFVQNNGNLWAVNNLNSRFKRICTNAEIGVKPYNIARFDRSKEKERIINSKTSTYNQHMLRHTYATRMIEAGVQAEVLQKLLGHKDITTTINTYTTIFDKFKNEQVNKFVQYMEKCN